MTRPCKRGKNGFTLIELVLVMALIALLLTLAVPRYFKSIEQGKLKVQQQNIASLRDAIDKFNGDVGRYPDTLQELVDKRYLRSVPIDPLTELPDWIAIAPPAGAPEGGSMSVFDVKSASAAAVEESPFISRKPTGGSGED
jgi:general secretion pathway protein G